MDFARAYARVASHLEARGYPLAVVGGLALHAHGITRATLDVDLVTAGEAQAELVAFLEAAGYETLHRSQSYSNHLHADPLDGRLDFVYVDPETAKRLFAGCRPLLELGADRDEMRGYFERASLHEEWDAVRRRL